MQNAFVSLSVVASLFVFAGSVFASPPAAPRAGEPHRVEASQRHGADLAREPGSGKLILSSAKLVAHPTLQRPSALEILEHGGAGAASKLAIDHAVHGSSAPGDEHLAGAASRDYQQVRGIYQPRQMVLRPDAHEAASETKLIIRDVGQGVEQASANHTTARPVPARPLAHREPKAHEKAPGDAKGAEPSRNVAPKSDVAARGLVGVVRGTHARDTRLPVGLAA